MLHHHNNDFSGRDGLMADGLLNAGRRRQIGVEIDSQAAIRRRLSRASNPVVPDMADRQAWILYDTISVGTNTVTASNMIFFQSPIAANKTKADTNLIQAGRLEDPQRFFVTALRFCVYADAKYTDINRLLKNYYLELIIGTKVYQEGPLVFFPGGAGQTGATVKSGESAWLNGSADARAINLLGEEGIWILQGQQFRVEVKTSSTFTTSNDADSTGLKMVCALDGILYRQIQ